MYFIDMLVLEMGTSSTRWRVSESKASTLRAVELIPPMPLRLPQPSTPPPSPSPVDENASLEFELQVNQVLFVGDTRILEVSMSVDLSCIDVMSKAVSKKVDWAEVAEDARVVANTADAILVPVLGALLGSVSVLPPELSPSTPRILFMY